MNEQKEVKIKKDLLEFIKKEFKPEGDAHAVEDLTYYFVDQLYVIFKKHNNTK